MRRHTRADRSGKDRPGRDCGFTGLEAALVLIAFIVVAAVFSYVVLNTGFFATQKSQEVIYAAVAQSDSILGPTGGVFAVTDPATGELSRINFSCRLAFGTTPVDFGSVTVRYSNASVLETLGRDPAVYNPAGCSARSGTWAVYQKINTRQADSMLRSGDEFMVSACPQQLPAKGDKIHIEIRPANGVAMDIIRTIGDTSDPVMRLH